MKPYDLQFRQLTMNDLKCKSISISEIITIIVIKIKQINLKVG